jgi:hypothetical protein
VASDRAARNEGPPSHEPDVLLDIPEVKVDEIYLNVDTVEAHVALRAKLANLVQLVAGVDVNIGKVELDIKGVVAQAVLKVRLENVYRILDRALTTLDRNPELIDRLSATVEEAAGDVGQVGQRTLGVGDSADVKGKARRLAKRTGSRGARARRREAPARRSKEREVTRRAVP